MIKQRLHYPYKNDVDDHARLRPTMQHILYQEGIGAMPWATLPQQSDDLAEIAALAAQYRSQCDHVVLCGTGGSSLGARTLADLVRHPLNIPVKGTPQLHIIESTDPEMLHAVLHDLPPERTGWIFISKSGGTLETMTQFLLHLEQCQGRACGPCTVITMPGKRPLRELAEKHRIRVLDHAPDLGGRFSVLSSVGLLPAAILGLNIKALRQGAAFMLTPDGVEQAAEAACWHMACLRANYATQIVMPYMQRLTGWTYWYRQLWAESLGKSGKGSTPLAAMGPVDHHSMLQLFLDGPGDKCLTTVCVRECKDKTSLPLPGGADGSQSPRHDGLGILNAQAYGTVQSFLNHDIPVRELELTTLNERSIGALLMLGMLETVFTADLLHVNAFDQPAVEESKLLAFQYLKQSQCKLQEYA